MPTEKITYNDVLRGGTDKLNSAIEQANIAEVVSAEAKQTANEAKTLFQEAFDETFENSTLETEIKNKLINLEQNYAPRLDEVTAQLAQSTAELEDKKADKTEVELKADKDDVYLKAIGININDFDEPTRQIFLEAQGIDVNYVLGVENVKPINASFFEIKGNLIDPSKLTYGKFVNQTNGTLADLVEMVVTDYLPVIGGETYIYRNSESTEKKDIRFAWYDENKVYISGGVGSFPTTAPANAKFIRISNFYPNAIHHFELEKTYAGISPFNAKMNAEYLKEKTIEPDKTTFFEAQHNLVNPEKFINGEFVVETTGKLASASNMFVSVFIEVAGGLPYRYKNSANAMTEFRFAWYDENKNFISGGKNTYPSNAPSNAKYFRFSNLETSGTHHFEQTTAIDEILPFEIKLSKKYLHESEVVPTGDSISIINLPPTIPALVGQELNIFFNDLTSYNLNHFNLDVTCSIGRHYAKNYNVTPTNTGTYPITISIYKFGQLIQSATSNIVVKGSGVGSGVNKKVLVIGDSTVDLNDETQRVLDKFNTDVMDITLLGTKGTTPNNHEGISGWTAAMFRGNTSPFHNITSGDFDLGTYMSKNGFSNLDYFIIQLGINDVFSFNDDESLKNAIQTVFGHYDAIVNNVKSYNSNIKIGINITMPPSNDQYKFGASYYCNQNAWRYKRNNIIWVDSLINHYKNREQENIYLIPIHVALDTQLNMKDGVHPKTEGFNQLGDMLYYWLKSFEI